METEYLSIKDFAQRAGVSQQSLYKRLNKLNNQLNNYIKLVENQKMIDIRALQEIYGIEVEQPIQPVIQPVEQPIQPSLQVEIEEKNDLIEFLKDQLRAKDEQIERMQHDGDTASDDTVNETVLKQLEILNEQLKNKDKQIENMQKLLDQEQHLNAMNHEKILLLESKLEEPNETDPKEYDEPPKGFWSRFFKK